MHDDLIGDSEGGKTDRDLSACSSEVYSRWASTPEKRSTSVSSFYPACLYCCCCCCYCCSLINSTCYEKPHYQSLQCIYNTSFPKPDKEEITSMAGLQVRGKTY